MKELTKVSNTLYIPLQARVYANIVYPDIFKNRKSAYIWRSVSKSIKRSLIKNQTDYTLLAAAVRSKNMDLYIRRFLKEFKDGIVINVGCGLESFYYRNDNGYATWYNLDLPEVLELRRKYFKNNPREINLAYDMFDYRWMDEINVKPDQAVLVVVAGVFHYFREEEVLDFINALNGLGNVEVVFDAVSMAGLKVAQKHLRDTGNKEAYMYFGLDNLHEFVDKLDYEPRSCKMMRYYKYIRKFKAFSPDTTMRFTVSDNMNMLKMVHIKF